MALNICYFHMDEKCTNDCIGQYERDVKRTRQAENINFASTEKQKDLLKKIETTSPGSKERQALKNQVILANLYFVIHLAKKYRGFEMDLPDLIQEGNLALIKALEKYDPKQDAKFSTYAYVVINQNIQRALQEHGRTIRIPLNQQVKIKELENVTRKLRKAFRKQPSLSQVAKTLKWKITEVIEYKEMAQPQNSFEDIASAGGLTYEEILSDNKTPENLYEKGFLKSFFNGFISQNLTEIERDVIIFCQDIETGKKSKNTLTYKEIGQMIGQAYLNRDISRAVIKNIHLDATKKLRDAAFSDQSFNPLFGNLLATPGFLGN